jgi:hypothetical protein
MLAYYEKLVEYWKTGKVVELYIYFNEWKAEGLLDQEEIEKLEKIVPELFKLLYQQCLENPNILYGIYDAVKKGRGWDDKTFCKITGVSQEDLFGIKNRNPNPKRNRTITNKILNEFVEILKKKYGNPP